MRRLQDITKNHVERGAKRGKIPASSFSLGQMGEKDRLESKSRREKF